MVSLVVMVLAGGSPGWIFSTVDSREFCKTGKVVDGFYDGMKLRCTDQAILSDSELDKNRGFTVPLEIMPSGQFEPLYKTILNVQDGELPVLPLSVYGAVAMSGLGGLSFDEGQFSFLGIQPLEETFLFRSRQVMWFDLQR